MTSHHTQTHTDTHTDLVKVNAGIVAERGDGGQLHEGVVVTALHRLAANEAATRTPTG